LAHITYTRDTNPREITSQSTHDVCDELKKAWKTFRGKLPAPLAAKFELEIKDKLATEFRDLDLW
jgi:hypothetical protein